jgi:hypothetical protein
MSAIALHIPLACRESQFWFALSAGGVQIFHNGIPSPTKFVVKLFAERGTF